MVKLASLILTALFALVSATPAKKDVVTAVVAQISHDTDVLKHDASSIGKGLTFKKALSLNSAIQAVQRDLDNGTAKITGISALPADEANNIVGQIYGMTPAVRNILDTICAKRPFLKRLPVDIDSLAQRRLTQLSVSTDTFLVSISVIVGTSGAETIGS
ncbi:hypothetical protein AX14_010311, partial [Amanita brunnescens Koide BX004]